MSHDQPAGVPAQRLLPPAANWAYRPVAVGHDARFDAEKPSFGRLNSLNRPDAVALRLKGDGLTSATLRGES